MPHACPICYQSVRHPQQVTCGGFDCRDAWKHLNTAARRTKQNLASYSPSERALILAQGPTPEQTEAQLQQHGVLDNDLKEYAAQQKKKEVPAFIRQMLDPSNAPISKKEDPTND